MRWYVPQERRCKSAFLLCPMNVRRKENNHQNLVTDFDVWVQNSLKTGLAEIAPEAAFFAEEKENQEMLGLTWIVDPIDGTTNFISTRRDFAICVALYDGASASLRRCLRCRQRHLLPCQSRQDQPSRTRARCKARARRPRRRPLRRQPADDERAIPPRWKIALPSQPRRARTPRPRLSESGHVPHRRRRPRRLHFQQALSVGLRRQRRHPGAQ